MSDQPKYVRSVLITDLDDTLWDWLEMWYASFQPMLTEIVRILGRPEEEVLRVIQQIHQKRGTAEYTFLIQDIEAAYGRYPPFSEIKSKYDTALHAFRRGRKAALKLYENVYDTLHEIKRSGGTIVAYTESMAYPTIHRLRHLDLDGVISVLYSPRDHDFPKGVDLSEIRSHAASAYSLSHTLHRHTPDGEVKPNPDILLSIIGDLGATPEECVYVGDKLVKDVWMAKQAGVLDVFAAYGEARERPGYDLLRSVTHWPVAAVQIERTTNEEDVRPTIVLRAGFSELLANVKFSRRPSNDA